MIKKSDKKYAKVCGCDEYGREAWLMVSQHRDTDKVEVLSSEEGEPVVYTKSQISELIKELKKYVKLRQSPFDSFSYPFFLLTLHIFLAL